MGKEIEIQGCVEVPAEFTREEFENVFLEYRIKRLVFRWWI